MKEIFCVEVIYKQDNLFCSSTPPFPVLAMINLPLLSSPCGTNLITHKRFYTDFTRRIRTEMRGLAGHQKFGHETFASFVLVG